MQASTIPRANYIPTNQRSASEQHDMRVRARARACVYAVRMYIHNFVC